MQAQTISKGVKMDDKQILHSGVSGCVRLFKSPGRFFSISREWWRSSHSEGTVNQSPTVT